MQACHKQQDLMLSRHVYVDLLEPPMLVEVTEGCCVGGPFDSVSRRCTKLADEGA